jgi:tripartite-type tricarboxylate transporter receptor subunit TctC
MVARLVADISRKYFAQPIFVTDKPGAVGSIAAADVISSKPEGYKLLCNNHPYFAGTVHTQKLPFDPHDLVPLASLMELRMGLCVKADSPFKTFKDVVIYARKNPDTLKWAHPGRGTPPYITPKIIFEREKVSLIDVPFKGGAVEAATALMGGHVDLATVTHGAVVEHVRAGEVRYLMYYTDERYKDSPNVPTAAELGYLDAVVPSYTSLFIHKDTPENIKKMLVDVCKKVYDDPEFQSGLRKIEGDPKWGGPEFLEESIKKSERIAVPVLKEAGLYVGK